MLSTYVGSSKEQEKSRKKHLLLLHCYTRAFDCGLEQTGKFLKRWTYQTTLPASGEIFMQVKKQQLELDMEQ